MKPDQRLFPRKPLDRPVLVRLKGGRTIAARTADIALGGVCLITSKSLRAGVRCLICFEVPLEGVFQRVHMLVQVTNSAFIGLEATKIGMKFIEIDEASAVAISKYMGIPLNYPQKGTENEKTSDRPI